MAGGPTSIPYGDPKAVKRWSGTLFLEINRKSYWDRKFVKADENAVIQRLTDLEQDAGDTITYDLSVQLRQKPTQGDNRLEGKEEGLKFFSDQVSIDQLRHGVSAGGKMSRKRTVHNIRQIAKARLSDYWAKYIDELYFVYLSGARGINANFIEDLAYVGFANNPLTAPDAGHIAYGGTATAKNNVTSNDKMSKAVIEKAEVRANMMQAMDPSTANMMPVTINGENHYVCIMSPFQEHDLRTADTTGWLEIQKAAITAEGRNNPIFKGGLGMIKNTVLHAHTNSIRFSDYGVGVNLPAGRALFLGRQAGVIAFGSANGLRFTWTEEIKDHGNEPVVAAGFIGGVKKSRFNSKDFGVISIDTYAANPNA